MNKKILSLVIALVLVLGSVTTVFAGNFDLIHKLDSRKNTAMLELMEDLDVYDQVFEDFANYELEYESKKYALVDIQEKLDAGADGLQEAIEQIDKGEEPSGGLEVVEVSAINKTEVIVELANVPSVLPAPGTFTVEDSNGNIYAVTGIALVAGNEYKLTLGTSVSGKGTLTVKYGTSQAELAYDYTLEGTTLSMEFSDENAELVADGADNTIVTVKVLKDGIVDETFDGTVKFMSLKGATFAKETVAFDKGIAKVQLTSMSSAIAIVDTIIATISDADDFDAIGKSVQKNISYIPVSQGGEVLDKVFITYAESDRASDVFVKFNKEFNFDKLYLEKGKFSILSNGVSKAIADIVKVDSETVKLVLLEANALTDNAIVKVQVTGAGQATSVLIDSDYSFNLVDPKAPEALGVTAPDYRTIVTRFTEPVSETTAEKPENWVLNGQQLTAADVAIKVGKDVAGTIVDYVADGSSPVDNRNYVTLELTAAGAAKLKAAGKTNLLQAYGIMDYAGLTDKTGQNIATTQEFTFVTPEVPGAPTAEIIMESPEQFRVKFDQPLANVLDANNFEVRYQVGERLDGTPIFIGDADEPATLVPVGLTNPTMVDAFAAGNNVVVTAVGGSANDEYILEFAQDWTVTLDTKTTKVNYYTPGRNNLEISIIAAPASGNAVESLLGVQMPANYKETETMTRDNVSAEIEEAYQNVAGGSYLQEFTVIMNEPVQMNTGVTANDTKEITPSQTQADGDGVPTPTFQFISEDEKITIDGELKTAISDDDYEFVIVPKTPLTAGIWTISIRSISDDVGNTSPTAEYELEVIATTDPVGKSEIIWADAHDNVDFYGDGSLYDIVHIQFGTEMSLDALKSNVYTINGKILPVNTMITSVEAFYDSDEDSSLATPDLKGTRVTIVLPKEFLGDITETDGGADPSDFDSDTNPNNTPHMLNVSKTLTDVEGEVIEGPTEVQLPYNKYVTIVILH